MKVRVPATGQYGLIKDPYEQDLPPSSWTDVRNTHFTEQGARSIRGSMEVLLGATIGDVRWLKSFPDREIPRWVYANNNRVFLVESLAHSEITRYTATPGDNDYSAIDRWQGTIFNGIGILNNGFDAPQQWGPMTSLGRLEDLNNWPTNYRCRFIKPFRNFLIAGHIYTGASLYPYRVQWSHPADPGSTPASWAINDPVFDSGQFDFGETSDVLVDGLEFGSQFIVYREQSTYVMQPTGGSDIFRKDRLIGAGGLLWKDCAVNTPKGQVAATWDDFVIHQGTAATYRSVVEGNLRKWINANRNDEYYYNCFLVLNPPDKEVWYCFPQEGYEYATLAVVWNWETGRTGTKDLLSVPFADNGPIEVDPDA